MREFAGLLFSEELEESFRRLGEQIGRELAARILAEREQAGTPVAAARREPRPPTSKARILPGLTGRRRRPGEAPPRCGRAGCDKPSRTRGYCQTHYVQWLKAGSPVESLPVRNVG